MCWDITTVSCLFISTHIRQTFIKLYSYCLYCKTLGKMQILSTLDGCKRPFCNCPLVKSWTATSVNRGLWILFGARKLTEERAWCKCFSWQALGPSYYPTHSHNFCQSYGAFGRSGLLKTPTISVRGKAEVGKFAFWRLEVFIFYKANTVFAFWKLRSKKILECHGIYTENPGGV